MEGIPEEDMKEHERQKSGGKGNIILITQYQKITKMNNFCDCFILIYFLPIGHKTNIILNITFIY